MMIGVAATGVLPPRASVIHAMGQAVRPEGEDPLALVVPHEIGWMAAVFAGCALAPTFLSGRERRGQTWIGIVLLVMPVFLPIVKKLPVEEIGFLGGPLDPSFVAVWFGVVFCMNMQVSFLSPPFGPAAFYLKSVAPPHISLVDIFRGFLPFIAVQILALSVLLLWPRLAYVLFG